MLLRRDAAYVTSAILPIRNVNLTLLPIDRIVLILKAELFLRPQPYSDQRPQTQIAPGYGIAKTSVLGGLHHEYHLVKEAP